MQGTAIPNTDAGHSFRPMRTTRPDGMECSSGYMMWDVGFSPPFATSLKSIECGGVWSSGRAREGIHLGRESATMSQHMIARARIPFPHLAVQGGGYTPCFLSRT